MRVADILAAAARTEIMPRFRNLDDGAIRQKTSAIDLVTDADEAAEKAITADLHAAFPAAVVVGEEATARDASLLERYAEAELAVIVDPIDGTRNFASGLPLFGVMAGVVMRGEVVAGIIHDPVGGDTAIARRGEGAWIERPDRGRVALKVAAPVPLARMEGLVATTFIPPPLRAIVGSNLAKLAAVANYRCAAHEYRLAAGGHVHLLLYNKLMPWDHAAGWLLHREAGGFSAHFDGSEYKPTHVTGGLICAPDQQSWELARDALLGSEARLEAF